MSNSYCTNDCTSDCTSDHELEKKKFVELSKYIYDNDLENFSKFFHIKFAYISNNRSNTLFEIACYNGAYNFIIFLLQSNIDYNFNIYNSKHHTPFKQLIYFKRYNVASIIALQMLKDGFKYDDLPQEIKNNKIVLYYMQYKTRQSYLMLIEGHLFLGENPHIQKYLFNEMICREVCSFTGLDEHLKRYVFSFVNS